MKSILVLALTLFSVSSFAQGPGGVVRGSQIGRNQAVQTTIYPGQSTYVNAGVPTQVYCAPSYQKVVSIYAASDCYNGLLSSITSTNNRLNDEQLCRNEANRVGNRRAGSVLVNGRCTRIDGTFMVACMNGMQQ